MARMEFFRDIRRALSMTTPRVQADDSLAEDSSIERVLRNTDGLWLSPGVVSAFRPEDFDELAAKDREELSRAVSDFLAVARAVPPDERATAEQRDKASRPFAAIARLVGRLLREDWLRAAAALLAEAEGWAKEAGWPSKRYPKVVAEDLIGSYKQDKLVFSAEGSQLALVPVGRFAPGTDGMFDLAVMPAYDSVMVVRKGDRWFVHPLPGEDGRRDWSKETFYATSHELASLP